MKSKGILSLIVLVTVVLIGSLILGSAAAQEDFVKIGIFVAVIGGLAVFLGLGRSTWVMIPIFLAWDGYVGVLPLPFSVSNLAVGFALTAWFLHILTRRESFRWRVKGLDLVIGSVLFFVFFSFLRNPVGVKALGESSLVGGRPYFEVFMAFVAYIMLCSVKPDLKWFNRIPYLTVIAAAVLAVGGGMAFFVPQVGFVLYQLYTGFSPNVTELIHGASVANSTVEVGRAAYLTPLSVALVYYLYASKSPLQNAMPVHPFRLGGLITAAACALLSGFRGVIGTHGVVFFLASTVWSGLRGAFATFVLGFMVIISIFVASFMFTLPDKVQRAVSFLPGNWDSRIVDSGDDSTEWRVEMWEEAIYGTGIKNKWLGDGFGIEASEIAYHTEKKLSRTLSTEEEQRFHVLAGTLHSGPLTAVRYIGAIGLVFYLILAITVAVGFTRLWRDCTRRGEKILVGFFALPALYHPIKYVFIFGSFDIDFPKLMISAGLLVLSKNLVRAQREEAVAAEQEAATQNLRSRVLSSGPAA